MRKKKKKKINSQSQKFCTPAVFACVGLRVLDNLSFYGTYFLIVWVQLSWQPTYCKVDYVY